MRVKQKSECECFCAMLQEEKQDFFLQERLRIVTTWAENSMMSGDQRKKMAQNLR